LIASEVPLNLYCISCGYNQRGISSAHCPECGQDFIKLPPSPSRLPWLHRRYRGFLRSYWRTVMMVIFRPKDFCDQIDNPITLRDARLFWLLTIAHVFLPLLCALFLIILIPSQPASTLEQVQVFIDEALVLPKDPPVPMGYLVLLGLLVFIIFATGMPSYFCHPATLSIARQNRAIAMSYFAGAPLALMPVVVTFALVAELVARFEDISLSLRAIAAALVIFIFIAWYLRTAGIVVTLSGRRRLPTVLLLTLSWIFLLVLLVMVVPRALWYASTTIRILFSSN